MDTSLPWIAIVDDELAIRTALLRLLDAAGFAARAYACGTDLLDALAGNPPCCVVLDLHMPGIDGHEVQARLASLAPCCRVIAMTGQHTAQSQALVESYAHASYLLKPMPANVLLELAGGACAAWERPALPYQQEST